MTWPPWRGTTRVTTLEADHMPQLTTTTTFRSVQCAVWGRARDAAVLDQAAALAGPTARFERVPISSEAAGAPFRAFNGHDLLVVGPSVTEHAVVRGATVPVLVARPCPPARRFAEDILLAID